MNTNQNDTFGQGNRDSQHPNQDANSNQSGKQYGGSESDRFSGNDGRQNDDQRLSSHPDGNESDSRNSENDNEDRRLGERDFNSGNAGSNDQNRPFTVNSEEDQAMRGTTAVAMMPHPKMLFMTLLQMKRKI